MVLQRILITLINKAQLVERLAESKAIRRAAQLTAFAITKGQLASGRLLDSSRVRQLQEEVRKMPRSASRLSNTFIKEVKDGMKEASRQMKDRK